MTSRVLNPLGGDIAEREFVTPADGRAADAPVAPLPKRIQPQLVLPFAGIGSWAVGVLQLRQSGIGSNGLLASGSVWFVLGLVLMLVGFILELSRSKPRGWLLMLHLVGLIVAIHSTVPIISGTPEWVWTYKHIGIASAFQHYGRISDPTNIYQQWPVLFAGLAAISSLAHVNALAFAAWAPLAFELGGAVMLLALFRLVCGQRRIAWLAVLLYEGLISWVGQDYLSPQAFAYLLWLAIALIVMRWLRAPAPASEPRGRVARLRAPLLRGLPPAPDTSRAMRAVAVALVATIYVAIVAAHQLSPYMAIAAIAALTTLDLIRPRWLVVLLAAIAGGYLALHYGLIAKQFGGLFSGSNPLANAGGAHGTPNASSQAVASAILVDGLIGAVWLTTSVLVLRRRREFGRVVIAAAFAFSPFAILMTQSYGGEAIYRVYLFSAPWCALLIAGSLSRVRMPLRWPLAAGVASVFLFTSLQGLYGPVLANAFTPAEVRASIWLYGHIPSGSLIVLPVDDFPDLETANYQADTIVVLPADPQSGQSWMDEGNLPQVERWLSGLGARDVYIVLSHSMGAWARYYGAPKGYAALARALPVALSRSVVYRNSDATVFRLNPVASGPVSQPSSQARPTRAACGASCGPLRSLRTTPPTDLARSATGSASPATTAPAPEFAFTPLKSIGLP